MIFPKIEPYITKQILITACLNLGQILNGYAVFWTAPVIPKFQNMEETPLSYIISETESSWIASFIFIGGFVSYGAGSIANAYGRKSCLILGGIISIIAFMVFTFANAIGLIYLGRCLVGISVGFVGVGTLIYLGEIASPNIRGTLLTSTSIFHSFGGLLMYCVGPFVSYAEVSYVIICIGVVYVVACFFLPESPLYYVIKGNEDAAKESFRKIGRSNDIDTELKKMLEQSHENKNKYVWKELLTEKVNQNALLVVVPLFFFQQSSGILIVIFFATTIFEMAGSSVEPYIATIIVGATMFISSIFSPMFIEKYGRRILLMISTAGCCVVMAVLGVYFYLNQIGNSIVLKLGWLPLACLVLAIFFYGVGLTIIPNTLAGEMFGSNVRGLGTFIGLCTGWLSGLLATTIFGYVEVVIGTYATLWMFAAFDFVALIFIILVVPETRGKTLLEIETMMNK